MRLIATILASAILTLNACFAQMIVAADSPAKVDLEQLVETGKVVPVDGITPAGQPDTTALKVFADNGYAAVIDLRTDGENRGLDEKSVVEDLGMIYVSMPIGRDDITFENAQVLDDLLASFNEPVLLHCASSNRVGALLALRASLHGVDDSAALNAGKRGGLTGLEQRVRKLLSDD